MILSKPPWPVGYWLHTTFDQVLLLSIASKNTFLIFNYLDYFFAIFSKAFLSIKFEGEMLMRIQPRTPHQLFCEFKLNSKVTVKNKKSPDDKKISMVWQLGTDFATLFFLCLFSRAFLSIKFCQRKCWWESHPELPINYFANLNLIPKLQWKTKKVQTTRKSPWSDNCLLTSPPSFLLSVFQSIFVNKIWKGNVDENPTQNSPSIILWI